uniref:Uncharacterized protein n=1 Tax=Strigops habroptila TaxID=2489341 RepID=A0A672TL52_STRHB
AITSGLACICCRELSHHVIGSRGCASPSHVLTVRDAGCNSSPFSKAAVPPHSCSIQAQPFSLLLFFICFQALIYYCEALTQPNLQLQKAACLALRYLKATESIKMLVTLCQSDNEEIRKVASETLLALGEDGRLAYEQLDKFPREFVRVGSRRGTDTATAF